MTDSVSRGYEDLAQDPEWQDISKQRQERTADKFDVSIAALEEEFDALKDVGEGQEYLDGFEHAILLLKELDGKTVLN